MITEPFLFLCWVAGLHGGEAGGSSTPCLSVDKELDLLLLVGLLRGLIGIGGRPLNLRLLESAAYLSPSIFFSGILTITNQYTPF